MVKEKLTALFILCPLAVLWMGAPLSAEPYIAFRQGFKCSTCHLNHTGGGKRTEFGFLFTQTDLQPLMKEASEKAGDFSTQIGDHISIGSDLMFVHESTFSVDERLEEAARVELFTQDDQNTFDLRRGSAYLEFDLVPDTIILYLDELLTPSGASSREAFILLQGLPLDSYIKAGRMFLPYGIRLWDNDAFIRRVSGFNYDNQDMGVEIGFEPGDLALNIAFSNGTQGGLDNNTSKQVSAVGSMYLGNAVLGASFSWNRSRGIKRVLSGPYASLRVGPFTLMGEADWMSESGATDQDQFIWYSSLEYWVRQSLNFRVAYDYLDPYDNLDEDERSRLTLGVDAFLTPFLQAQAYYRIKESVPQDPQGNADLLTLALHAFF